jgi:hypothetical protein
VITIILGVIALIHWLHRSPSFSNSIANYKGANNFISFLKKNETQQVKLNVTCIQPASQSACDLSNNGTALRVYGSATAANCWNNNPAGPCSDGVLITFVQSAGGSGTFSGNGAGNYFINGSWTVRGLGSGGNVPEGDSNYQLDSVSSTSS